MRGGVTPWPLGQCPHHCQCDLSMKFEPNILTTKNIFLSHSLFLHSYECIAYVTLTPNTGKKTFFTWRKSFFTLSFHHVFHFVIPFSPLSPFNNNHFHLDIVHWICPWIERRRKLNGWWSRKILRNAMTSRMSTSMSRTETVDSVRDTRWTADTLSLPPFLPWTLEDWI